MTPVPTTRKFLTAACLLSAAIALPAAIAGCSKASSAIATAASPSATLGSTTITDACSLVTKADVSAATGATFDIAKGASHGSVKACAFVSMSGIAITVSITTAPQAGLTADIPGLGNVVSTFHMSQVSGIGDQAYASNDELVATKGSTLIFISDTSTSGGGHQQAMENLAKTVLAKV